MRSSSHLSFLLRPIQVLFRKLTQPQHHSLEAHKSPQLHQLFFNPVIVGIGLTKLGLLLFKLELERVVNLMWIKLSPLTSAYEDGASPSNSFILDTTMDGDVHPVPANKILPLNHTMSYQIEARGWAPWRGTSCGHCCMNSMLRCIK